MALYLKPPRGMIDYHILQKCVETRLKFYEHMLASSVSIYNIEYLYEDSAFDRAGHFTLRLAAVKRHAFLSYFIDSELKLLKLRLDLYNRVAVHRFLKNQLRHARECIAAGECSDKIIIFLKVFTSLMSKMITRNYQAHVFNDSHVSDSKCKLFTLNVPFQHCSSLIRNRTLPLKNGYVQIPCQKWKDLFVSFFCTYLRAAISDMHYSRNAEAALEDERIKLILASVFPNENINYNLSITLPNIDLESKFFPPCMQHLQNVLREKHRLAHEERFNLSLFLKDIGMSLDDSITYWKTEYSKEHAECSKCTHNWQQNERKYVYSIRHLYGLEGSRKTYTTRSCSYFHNMTTNPTQEGGCPFKHFSDANLKTLLSKHLNGDEDRINSVLLKRSPNALNACNLFLKLVNSDLFSTTSTTDTCTSDSPVSSSNCDTRFSNPVQYFFLIKNTSNN